MYPDEKISSTNMVIIASASGVGGLVLLIALVTTLYFWRKRLQKRREMEELENNIDLNDVYGTYSEVQMQSSFT